MQHTLSVVKGKGENAEADAIQAWKDQVSDLGWQPGKRAVANDKGEVSETTEPEVVTNGGIIRVQGPVEPKSDDTEDAS